MSPHCVTPHPIVLPHCLSPCCVPPLCHPIMCHPVVLLGVFFQAHSAVLIEDVPFTDDDFS
ncbi:PREDICTED: ribonuclease kappa, partial [Tinamus guttatus]|uniref:ribonuclease kappa n=1 Tax=Tinamus guttatus TaxID=94827 RepID=UPI00052E9FEA